MLIRNRSIFLETVGSVACLYHCHMLWPLKVLDKCYDRLAILFERTTKFVDKITHQTYDFASEIHCLGDYTNVFQLDHEIDNPWYQLSPDPMPFNKPQLFKPTELGHNTQLPTFDTRRAGMYTPKEMKLFWHNIIFSFRHSPTGAQKDRSHTRQNSSKFRSWKLRTPFESGY